MWFFVFSKKITLKKKKKWKENETPKFDISPYTTTCSPTVPMCLKSFGFLWNQRSPKMLKLTTSRCLSVYSSYSINRTNWQFCYTIYISVFTVFRLILVNTYPVFISYGFVAGRVRYTILQFRNVIRFGPAVRRKIRTLFASVAYFTSIERKFSVRCFVNVSVCRNPVQTVPAEHKVLARPERSAADVRWFGLPVFRSYREHSRVAFKTITFAFLVICSEQCTYTTSAVRTRTRFLYKGKRLLYDFLRFIVVLPDNARDTDSVLSQTAFADSYVRRSEGHRRMIPYACTYHACTNIRFVYRIPILGKR